MSHEVRLVAPVIGQCSTDDVLHPIVRMTDSASIDPHAQAHRTRSDIRMIAQSHSVRYNV